MPMHPYIQTAYMLTLLKAVPVVNGEHYIFFCNHLKLYIGDFKM